MIDLKEVGINVDNNRKEIVRELTETFVKLVAERQLTDMSDILATLGAFVSFNLMTIEAAFKAANPNLELNTIDFVIKAMDNTRETHNEGVKKCLDKVSELKDIIGKAHD